MGETNHLFVTKPRTLEKLYVSGNGVWPVRRRWAHALQSKIAVGDEALIYVKGIGSVAGLLEVTGSIHLDDGFFMNDDLYEATIPVKFKIVVEPEQGVPLRPLVNQLELTRSNPRSWGSALQKSVVRIQPGDFDLLKTKLIETYRGATAK